VTACVLPDRDTPETHQRRLSCSLAVPALHRLHRPRTSPFPLTSAQRIQANSAAIRTANAALVAKIRGGSEPYGLCSGGSPPQAPTSGTTATAHADSHGRFPTTVYFDWGTNWTKVEQLMRTPAIQSVLAHCVDTATHNDVSPPLRRACSRMQPADIV
jgi:hypothetical protein